MNWPLPLIVLASLVALLFLLLALFDLGIVREWFARTPLRRGLVREADERGAPMPQDRKCAAARPGYGYAQGHEGVSVNPSKIYARTLPSSRGSDPASLPVLIR
jgi:hypothetical protein